MLSLAFGLKFEDLYDRAGVERVDAAFLGWLGDADAALAERLKAARREPLLVDRKAHSELILHVAPHVDDFVARLFGIEAEVRTLNASIDELSPLYACKRLFVQRRAVKKYGDAAATADGAQLARQLESMLELIITGAESELEFARVVNAMMENEAANAEGLELAGQYAAWATLTPAGKTRHQGGVLFRVPGKIEPEKMLPLVERHLPRTGKGPQAWAFGEHHLRRREGFGLTDQGHDLRRALDQAHYCIFCHNQGKDSCSRGLKDKPAAGQTTAPFKKSHFGVTLAGCPLEERISEMHAAKTEGHSLAALAIVTVDNPMCAGTGHRICNDCMKACIYQKQEPVDIPQVETRVLKDVLGLTWGFEIYSLLTRWAPFDLGRPVPKPPTGKKVLVAGMGPAGFTLAHHLMNDGHAVVGVDGLKIEPLPGDLSGLDAHGRRVAFKPIRDVQELTERLDERVMAGFGGVAEYGITVRWDKNFLKIVRLLLERRSEFALFGAVRLGGTVTVDEAFAMGFDHVALAMGAGRPTVLPLPNGLARGVRAASDFLMALQLTGAARADTIANMQLRLPVVVIGGGLTAVDTATESLAYYPVQVEKFLARYEALVAERGDKAVRAKWDAEEAEIADEFLTHARSIRAERGAAARDKRSAKVRELLQSWGGVTIAYRKRLIDSPSYTLNHEEVGKALEEGIYFAEGLSPVSIEVDARGHAEAILLSRQTPSQDGDGKFITSGGVERLPARSILIAAGTQPNTVLAREDKSSVAIDGRYFRAVDEAGRSVKPEHVRKPHVPQVLASVRADGRAISFFGDLHPSFAGNVVGAMASARQGFPVVSAMLAKHTPNSQEPTAAFFDGLQDAWRATVHEVIRLTSNIIEVVVRAPAAASAFHPGQFYRLQNFETLASKANGTTLGMEGLALTGAWVDRDKGLVSVIVLEMGGSSDLCALLKPGEPVVLMGPTGEPTTIAPKETVLLAGGGLGNAVLFSIGRGFRAAGSRVLYFAGYRNPADRYHVADIEAAADTIIWCVDQGPAFKPGRPGDLTFVGNIVQAMLAYAEGKLGKLPIVMTDVDRIITIGSDRMMAAVGAARHGVLKPFLKLEHVAIASINSPMQCMMKEICAQCLQLHTDPETGEKTTVFSCFNQDQLLDHVEFGVLAQRLRQNSVQEKLTAQWIDRCLVTLAVRPKVA
ncbi:MAG: pyridine nucleotide-disulfide oxidoreductase [Alphaproteobacteria bacterium]|nr:pyridine nucleotide-disulfide oxidoreductase [Alphaproteobacteria bacterium]